MEALHIYCVTGSGTESTFGPIGLDGAEVFAVRHAELAAIVSRTPIRAYAAMSRPTVLLYLFAHQAAMERVMRERTVIPVKFGTLARDVAGVRTILARGHDPLTAALDAMNGRIELDIVAGWRDLRRTLLEAADQEEIRVRRAVVAARPPQETRDERIELGKLLKVEVDRMSAQRAAEIVAELASLAEAMRSHALVDERMILNIALLVPQSREPDVGTTLHLLNERYGDSIDFRCVGPLPPYSFGTVEVRSFEFTQVDRARRRLGLGEWSALPEVKQAYRRLAWANHPDTVSPETGGGRFDEVAAAYGILSEYCKAGGHAFKQPEVEETVAVRLFEWAGEAARA